MAKSLDLTKYKIKLNVASARLFEQISGKSFFKIGEEDAFKLAYSVLIANNPELNFTFNTFMILLQDKKLANWITREIEKENNFQAQLKFVKRNKVVEKAEEGSEDVEALKTISEYASVLIINFGMDAHYVNYEMPLYEMEDYFFVGEMKRRNDLSNQRLFTFLTMLPQLESKKKIMPEDILPFPWEKNAKKADAEEDLKKKQAMIMATFAAMNGGQKNG